MVLESSTKKMPERSSMEWLKYLAMITFYIPMLELWKVKRI